MEITFEGFVPAIGALQTGLPFHSTRNPVHHTGRGFRAKFASRKMARMIRCESLLEMSAVRSAEFARDIVAIDEQPLTLHYTLDGRTRRYTPDFRFRWRSGEEWLVEVKPEEKAREPRNVTRFRAISDVIASDGRRFVLLTEKQLRQPFRGRLIEHFLCHRWSRQSSDTESVQWGPDDVYTFSEAAEAVGGMNRLNGLLARRVVACDLDHEIGPQSLVRRFQEGDDHALFL